MIEPLISNGMVRNVINMRLGTTNARIRIAEVVKTSGKVFFSRHARERGRQRNVTRRQVLRCLVHGAFIEEPRWDNQHNNYQFTMRTVDAGDVINVVGALQKNDAGDYVVVITVF